MDGVGWRHTLTGKLPHFAEAGYLVLTFDYRGWGPSDSRVVLVQKSAPGQAGQLAIYC